MCDYRNVLGMENVQNCKYLNKMQRSKLKIIDNFLRNSVDESQFVKEIHNFLRNSVDLKGYLSALKI